MSEKIIKVFFDQSGLPYKDRELSTHYPLVGSGFLGASNTTKIRFYFENIGLLSDTYLAVSKLPNGKQGSQLLNIKSSDENGQYAELSLSEWYFQAKGDVFIGLKVYRGGVEVEIDQETGFSIVSGDPVIMVTGSIKLAINYAPIGDVPDYRDEFTAYNDILALMGEKPDIDTVPLLVNFSDYATWGALYEYVGTRPFVAYVNGVLSVCAIENEDSTYKLLVNNSTGIFRTSTFALESAISISLTEIEFQTDNCVELTGTSGTLTDEQLSLLSKDNSYIKVDTVIYTKQWDNPATLRYGTFYATQSSGIITFNYLYIQIIKGSKTYSVLERNYTTYNTTEVDALLSDKQNILVSGQNIKTINGQSILGSGDLPISGGGSAEWGSIGGDIADQTDLQNELQNIREVAEGKCNTFVISYSDTIGSVKSTLQMYVGNKFYIYNSTTSEWEDKTTELLNGDYDNLSICNSLFNSNNNYISPAYNDYLIVRDRGYNFKLIKTDIDSGGGISRYPYKRGDVILVVETDVPDRWFSNSQGRAEKLETSKIDLTNYATKSEVNAKSDLTNVAPAYDDTLTYTVGEVVSYNGKIYKCTTAITTPESWDSTHWAETSVASDFVNLTGTQVISGNKNYTGALQKNGVDVATTDQTFNVINASDIVNNTLTQAQYDLITNGKLTRVIGGLGGYAYTLLLPPTDRSGSDPNMYGIAVCQSNGQSCQYMPYKIEKSTLVISLITTVGVDYETGELRLLKLGRVNGKVIPAYPSNTGTFVLKCVDGTLTWVAE